MEGVEHSLQWLSRLLIKYLLELIDLCYNEVRFRNPSSWYFARTTPILPTILVLSAYTLWPEDRTKYPPEAARSFAKLYTFKLFFNANYLILFEIIWLWTGSPPGELTETANATARETEMFASLLATLSVLDKFKHTIQQ